MGDVIRFRPRGPVKMAFTRQPDKVPDLRWPGLPAIFAVCSAGLLLSVLWTA